MDHWVVLTKYTLCRLLSAWQGKWRPLCCRSGLPHKQRQLSCRRDMAGRQQLVSTTMTLVAAAASLALLLQLQMRKLVRSALHRYRKLSTPRSETLVAATSS